MDRFQAPLRAVVTATSGTKTYRGFAATGGNFRIAGLPPGTYVLCGQIPAMEAKSTEDPFLDTCLWRDPASPKITLGVSQTSTDHIIVMNRGHRLQVHVSDATGNLPVQPSTGANQHLSVRLKNSTFAGLRIPVSGRASGARNFELVVPNDVPHAVLIGSSTFHLTDEGGHDLSESSPISVQFKAGDAVKPIVVNVRGAK